MRSTLTITIILIVIILIYWLKSVRLIKALDVKTAFKDKERNKKFLRGIRDLQLSIGVSLVIIIWEVYNNQFLYNIQMKDSVTIVGLVMILVLSAVGHHDFKKGIRILRFARPKKK